MKYGYKPRFLKKQIDLPTLGDTAKKNAYRSGEVFHYTHHSLVFHKRRKVAIYSVALIDGARKLPKVKREHAGKEYKYDPNPEIPKKYQAGPEYYGKPYDHGHLARIMALNWSYLKKPGEKLDAETYKKAEAEALKAMRESNLRTNLAPQIDAYNRDEWGNLEDWVRNRAYNGKTRAVVFNIPVFDDINDFYFRPRGKNKKAIQVPSAYCKVICAQFPEGPRVACFWMPQEPFSDDLITRYRLTREDLEELMPYQRSLSEIESMTDLYFPKLHKYETYSMELDKGVQVLRKIRNKKDIII